MADRSVFERIDAWAATGLIDTATADRLRAAEAAEPADDPPAEPAAAHGAGNRTAVASLFGPSVTIGEVFAYVGAGFVIAAWHTLFSSVFNRVGGADFAGPANSAQAIQLAIPAIALAVVGWLLKRRGERERRAAGVGFIVATGHLFGAIGFGLQSFSSDPVLIFIVATAVASVAATLFRRALPSVLTQLTMLGALAGLAISLLGWLNTLLFPQPAFGDFGPVPVDQGTAQLRVVATLAWWILWAAGFGLIARLEGRQSLRMEATEADRANALRRANFTRFVAGMTAIGGTFTAFGQSYPYDRVFPVWLGDLVVLVVALVLIVIAFRRNATAYLLPAAIGVIGALSDLNATYVADQTGVGVALLVEGVILIGVGFVADRLRRRVWGEQRTSPEAAPTDAAAVEPAAVEPAGVEPAAVEPAAVDPGAVEPAALEPAAVEPAAA